MWSFFQDLGNTEHAVISDEVVLKVICGQNLVFLEASLDGIEHLIGFEELIISEDYFLQSLCHAESPEQLNRAVVSQVVACQIQFLKRRRLVDDDFEQGPSSLLVDVAVRQAQILQSLVLNQTLGQLGHSFRSKVVMVQFQIHQAAARVRM